MKPLRKIVLVEDQPDARLHLKKMFERTFGHSIEVYATYYEAESRIGEGELDILITDLELTQKESEDEYEYEGFELIEALRSKTSEPVVVCYSRYFARNQGLKDAAKDRGVDLVFERAQIYQQPAKNLLSEIVTIEKERLDGKLKKRPMETIKDLGTKCAVDRIGLATLKAHVDNHIRESLRDEVRALAGGFSGAVIVEVKSVIRPNQHAVNILKLSQRPDSLKIEIDGLPPRGTHYFNSSFIPDSSLFSYRGWHSVAVSKIRNRQTLAEFITSSTRIHNAIPVFEKMVTELLIAPAQESAPISSIRDSSERLQEELKDDFIPLSNCYLKSIHTSIEEIKQSGPILNSDDLLSIDLTDKLFKSLADGKNRFSRKDYSLAPLHGDFHCENVFVGEGIESKLIDFGRQGYFPRLYDIANLHVDILISRLISPKGTQDDLSGISNWLETYGETIFLAKPILKGGEPCLAASLIEIMVSKVLSIEPRPNEEEYSEAVLFHLLRYLRFSNIPTPKKVLCCRLIGSIVMRRNLIELGQG
jgi:CheY-like chemotaxis protein